MKALANPSTAPTSLPGTSVTLLNTSVPIPSCVSRNGSLRHRRNSKNYVHFEFKFVLIIKISSEMNNLLSYQGINLRKISSQTIFFSMLMVFFLRRFNNTRIIIPGTAIAQWLRCCATNQKVASSISAGVSEFFIDIKSFRSHYGPGVDSASN